MMMFPFYGTTIAGMQLATLVHELHEPATRRMVALVRAEVLTEADWHAWRPADFTPRLLARASLRARAKAVSEGMRCIAPSQVNVNWQPVFRSAP